jgi:hypothetical protein
MELGYSTREGWFSRFLQAIPRLDGNGCYGVCCGDLAPWRAHGVSIRVKRCRSCRRQCEICWRPGSVFPEEIV